MDEALCACLPAVTLNRECVVVCCSVLQCVAVCCSVLLCDIMCCSAAWMHGWSTLCLSTCFVIKS